MDDSMSAMKYTDSAHHLGRTSMFPSQCMSVRTNRSEKCYVLFSELSLVAHIHAEVYYVKLDMLSAVKTENRT